MSRCLVLLTAAGLTVGFTGVTPAHAATARAVVRPRVFSFQVTGATRPLRAYRADGASASQAAALLQLDHLAKAGVDRGLLTAASREQLRDSSSAESETESETGDDDAEVVLTPAGDLDAKSGKDVLEQRFIPSGSSTVVQLVAREGLTGALLWSRTEKVTGDSFEFAQGMRVGAASAPGVLLTKESFSNDGTDKTTYTALNGKGHQLWSRTSTVQESSSGDSSGSSGSSGSSSASSEESFVVPAALRSGAMDLVQVTVKGAQQTASDGTTTQNGSAAFSAITLANGTVRALKGGVSSSDGGVDGEVVPDQDGDGFDDLATTDSGSAHVIDVVKGSTGAAIWQNTDLPTSDGALIGVAGVITGAAKNGHHLPDLTVANGVASSSGLDDPTASTPTHGTVELLTGGTGVAVFSKDGDGAYPLLKAGVPAVGVVTDTSSVSGGVAEAQLVLEAFDVKGTSRWRRTFTLKVATSQTDDGSMDSLGGFAVPGVDLDGDGGVEGLVELFAEVGGDSYTAEHLVRSTDGSDLHDLASNLLGTGVTKTGTDRWRTQSTSGGVLVRLLRGSDSHQRWAVTLPGSKGIPADAVEVVGGQVGTASCSQVLVGGAGTQAVVEVLSSAGKPLWSLNRSAKDQHPGTVVRPKTGPKVGC